MARIIQCDCGFVAPGQTDVESVPLISSWESLANPKIPPPRRLEVLVTTF